MLKVDVITVQELAKLNSESLFDALHWISMPASRHIQERRMPKFNGEAKNILFTPDKDRISF